MTQALRILVVEDDPAIRKFLRIALGAQGYDYVEAATAAQALGHFDGPLPEVIILDLGLPDGDGMDLLRYWRRISTRPVIIISARGQERGKVEALDAGADDYLTKPFGTGELLARMRAVLRRHTAATPERHEMATGNLRMNVERREVTIAGAAISLTPLEFKLLEVLMTNRGKVLTHRYLLRAVWGPGYASETHYVRVYMNSLRRKLHADASSPGYITTEVGVGYRLRDDPET